MEESRALREAACTLEDTQSVRSDGSMEKKFQDTYEEVMALKRMLQDLLHGDEEPVAVEDKTYSDEQYSEDFEHEEDHSSAESSAPTSPCDPLSPRHLRDSWSSFSSSMRSSQSKAPVRKLMVVVPKRQRNVVKRITPTMAIHRKPSRKCISELKANEERESETTAASDKPLVARVAISKASAAVLRKSAHFEPDFQARVQDYIARTRQKREKIRLELAEKEDNEIKSSPVINRRSKRINRSISHLLAWNNEKESKLAHLRTEEVKKQESEFVGKPAIDPRSMRLFTDRDDEISGCKVEDRLHLLGLIYEYQQEERQLQQQRQEAHGQLKLAPHSGNLPRGDRVPVHERLFQQSKRAISSNESPSSTKRANNPALKANEESLVAAIERLCLMGDHYKQKRLRLQQQQDQQLLSMHNSKKITTKSRRLAIKKSNKDGKCGCVSRCRTCRLKLENPTAETSNSSNATQTRIDSAHAREIYERQLEWKQRNDKRSQSQRQAQDDIALSHCTFRNPYYHQAWAAMNSLRDQADSSSDSNTAFFERCMRWMANKERRVAHEKKFRQALEFEECTFRPYIRPMRSPSRSTAPATPASPTTDYDDRDSPFERQSTCCPSPRAKMDKSMEENLQYYIPPENEFSGLYEYDEQDLEALAATSPSEYEYDYVSQRRRLSGFAPDDFTGR